MRDKNDNVVIICSIENIDPMGVHTGDSITVAPAQTLTDREYQEMRDAAIAIIREIGVETGGSNVQFAVNPADGELMVIEMNPRVSRSSALASKATGFPIAKIAAKLAVGYTLDEIPNDITRETMASFEPTIDYVVTKIPRWTFEKFPETEDFLTTSMKSVGETMAIGRTFPESLQKAIRSLEIGRFGLLDKLPAEAARNPREYFVPKLRVPNSRRLFQVAAALAAGMKTEEIYDLTKIDPWFLYHLEEIVAAEKELAALGKVVRDDLSADRPLSPACASLRTGEEKVNLAGDQGATSKKNRDGDTIDGADEVATPAAANAATDEIGATPGDSPAGSLSTAGTEPLSGSPVPELLRAAKEMGFADRRLAELWNTDEETIRRRRYERGVLPVYKLVDTCAAEFAAYTPYYYSTYETEDEANPSDRPKVIILGGGPNRIGQGIEFDYCCHVFHPSG